jgi:hypothetical protein
METGGMDTGIAGIIGRPDLASGFGMYMAQPIAGLPAGGGSVNGGSGISGSVSVSGDVGTGQASLSLAAALVALIGVLYFATRSHQH